MSLAIILSTQLLTGCRAFVHPIASAPFLRAAYASSSFSSSFTSASKNTCHYNKSDRSCSSSLYSAVQQDVDRPSNTAAVAATVANGRTRVIAHDQDFLKPTLDTRNYRCIVLPNNLQVLIVSDPETDVEAAAVHIKAGHFDDPDTRAGLAHFNEHMLFLGTGKYPKENDFETFVGQNGGITNAYTDMEDTNYYFSVAPLDHDDLGSMDDGGDEEEGQEEEEEEVQVEEEKEGQEETYSAEIDDRVSQALSGGLDRFAQFFIAPLFNEEAVERELRAIDSEHLNSFTSESWRNYQLLKSTCNQNHPFSKFGCGNYNTLTNGGNINGSDAVSSGGSSPVPALKEFWKEKYVSENMKVCVLGRASLDEIQKEVEKAFAGVRSNGLAPFEKTDVPSVIFQKEHRSYGVAFGPEHLGLIREYVPLVEERTIKLMFATPPNDDPAIVESRPDRVVTHLLGHESPGSLHALLLEDGLINDLSSGVGLTTSDFSLCSLTLHLTPKGMAQRDHVLSLVWQYISLVKSTAEHNDEIMEAYHDELRQVSKTQFHFRENGDPTDFCSGAAELLHEYTPEKLLVGSSMPGPYNATVTKAFLERLRPDNCIINIQNSDFESGDDGEFECSAASSSWQFEKWYKAKYREVKIAPSLQEKWTSIADIDSRLHLPAMNSFLPTDFSLRSEDPEAKESFNEEIDYRKEMPKLLLERPGVQLWHKMDRTFKVPKTHLRLFLTSPDVYRSPRSMTLMRIYVKVLEDDLNSYIYDASIAGCSARVSCLPSGISISVRGFSEKLPHLLDVVTGRMLTIIKEMKSADQSSGLHLKFDKATKNLLRETKNFRLESPYETASYISRVLLEHNVWHVSNYIAELEGETANRHPLTLAECAKVAEESLTQRLMATFLCMGNINEQGAHDVVKLIEQNFLHQARPLSFEEIPKLRSMKMPTKEEAVRIFGPAVQNMSIPLKIEEMTYSASEENHAVEVILQCGAEYEMGYQGVALLELIGQMAYNSAYNTLRTQEQLGYIVSAFTRKTAGSAMGFSVLVQSSTKKPQELEERIENWLALFREELASMPAEDIAKEAAAVVASLLERNMRLSDEVGTAWGSIVSAVSLGSSYNKPPFERHAKLAEILTVEGNGIDEDGSEKSSNKNMMTKDELKSQVLKLWDRYFAADAPERRAVAARVYGHKAQTDYEANIGKPGYLSSYEDVRQLKQFLAQWPTAPYWIEKNSR